MARIRLLENDAAARGHPLPMKTDIVCTSCQDLRDNEKRRQRRIADRLKGSFTLTRL